MAVTGAHPLRETITAKKAPDYTERREQERDGRSEADLHAQRALVGLTIIQVFVGAFGLWLIWGTLKATRDAVREANDATKIASKALAITEIASDRQLRAYIGISDIKAAPSDGVIMVKVLIKNYGQTPAYDVHAYAGGWFGPFPSRGGHIKGGPPAKQVSGIPMAPTGTEELYCEIDPGGDAASVWAGHSGIYAYGYITYMDAFGKEREFRFSYRGTESTVMERGELRACVEGNSST
ncbi:MAG: hypothetical protein Q7T19_06415 [Caulobacter sp.]|nr:hypothetical protein [Caulobacter sp.]